MHYCSRFCLFCMQGGPEWFPLERTKSGKLQLKCHVISKDTLVGFSDHTRWGFPLCPSVKIQLTNVDFGLDSS